MNPVQKYPDKIISQWMEISRLMRQQMNPVQMHAMMIIKEHANLTMKEFAAFLHITSPSGTSLVNRLVRMKWVERVADKTNRKLVRLKLSAEGIKCVTRTMKEHTRAMHNLFSLLTIADQKQFVRILENLRSTLVSKTKKQ